MSKEPSFKLVEKDGEWRCSTPRLPCSFAVGKTADEAIEGCKIALKDYDNFLDHHYGRCGDDCGRCLKEPESKGDWARLEKCLSIDS